MKTTMPTVTALIPVYNGAAYLEQCLDSVLAQTMRRSNPASVEILVIDDGSTDETPSVLGVYADHIRIHRQNNGGPGMAKDQGLRLATAPWVALLDHDDWWHPEKLEQQVSIADSNSSSVLIHTGIETHYEGKGAGPPLNPLSRPQALVGRCLDLLFEDNAICNSTVMLRRETALACGGFSKALHGLEDYDLWLKLAKEHDFGFVEAPLTMYRVHPQQQSKKRTEMLHQEYEMLLEHRPLSQWRATEEGRRRIADLLDLWATFSLDSGELGHARGLFRRAASVEPSLRRLVRAGTSHLPGPVLDLARR